jgi:hypothetical protein
MAEENDRVARGRAAYASKFRLSEAEAVEELERIVGPVRSTSGGRSVNDRHHYHSGKFWPTLSR